MDADGEGSDTTSQNESEIGSHSSRSDDQNLDDKVYFGFFESKKATMSEVTLMTENSSRGSFPILQNLQLVSNGLFVLEPESDEVTSVSSVSDNDSGETAFQHVLTVNP